MKRPLQLAAAFAEVGIWHWFVLSVALFAGRGSFVAVAAWFLVNTLASLAFARSGGWAKRLDHVRLMVLAWYVIIQRVITGLSQGPGLWSAIHIAPWPVTISVALAAALVAARLAGRRVSVLHALTLPFAVSCLANVAGFAGWIGTSCDEVLRAPGLTPLLLFQRVAGRPADDPLFDGECDVLRTIDVDPRDGALFVACGPEAGASRVHAVIRLLPDSPEQRVVLEDAPAIEALPIPGTERVAVSIMGRDVVRFVDRTTLAPLGETPLSRPLALAWDERAERVLVGFEREPGCVAAIDAATATRTDGHVGALAPSADELRGIYAGLELDKTNACLPTNCAPSRIVVLPDSGLVVAGNSSGTCTWQALSYDGLERVFAAEWLSPSRGLKLSPDGRELWVAMSFHGRLAVLDAKTLALVRKLPMGFGGWWFDWLSSGDVVVGNYVNGELRRIDPVSGAVKARTSIGSKVREVRRDPSRDRLYVASRCGVYALDPALALAAGSAPVPAASPP